MILLTIADNVVTDVAEEVTTNVNTLTTYFENKWPDIISYGLKILAALILFFIGRIIIKWICRLVDRSLKRSSVDKGVEQFIGSLLKVILYVVLVVILITNLGVETTSIAALVASGGVAIGLALQGSLSNFAGGVLILLLKPFVVGDYIIEDNHGNEGTVKEIQIFYTKLATVDNKTIIIPNGTLANTSLTNVTAGEHRQLDLQVSVAYYSDLKKAKAVMEEVLLNNDKVLKEQPYQVFVSDLGENAVIVGIRAWTKTDEYMLVRWSILEELKLSLEAAGIEIWPSASVNISQIKEK